ncbi:MAG TPA: type II toxin-antitoxin system RelE/ParE family toxin [Verrucomicrobiae bacterium]|jgi:mRNA interferase RelE/StbE|nr:type II toxin-antitoxin system RelE/ParE family toxin [Verrucomicrobiae bacterium]
MRYSLEFTESAVKELRNLDRQTQRRVTEKITALCENPFPPGVKKLKAEVDHLRIRVGDYRVVYRIDGARIVVVTVRIGHRKHVYR